MKYEFINWDKESFSKFLKNIKLESEIDLILNDNLAKFIDLLFSFFLTKEIKLNLIKKEELDFVIKRNIKNYFTNNFQNLINDINFKFINFNHEEISFFLEEHRYFFYCKKEKIIPKLSLKNQDIELEKLNKYKNKFSQYNTFNLCLDFYNKNKTNTYFNFPEEKKINRFVFYFYLYDNNFKKNIIELLIKCKVNQKIIDKLSNINISKNIVLFAVGFSYSEDNLIRHTLYTRFFKFNNKNNLTYINQFDNFINFNLNDVVDFAVDYYLNNKIEYKFYFKEYYFNIKLENNDLEKVLSKKGCIKVIKVLYNKDYINKFEFALNLFNNNEVNILKKYNLYKENYKILALYIKDNRIIKNILYDV